MRGNYVPGSDRDRQRKLWAGIKDARYGTLTYGHQYGVYYSVVGIKSDVWDNDGHAGLRLSASTATTTAPTGRRTASCIRIPSGR